MTRVKDLHARWMKDSDYREQYESLDEEFQIARALIEARNRAGLSQTELAHRMDTSQSYVARIESGQVQPSAAALSRFAHATGSRLKIMFEPIRRPVGERKVSSKKGSAHTSRKRAGIRRKTGLKSH